MPAALDRLWKEGKREFGEDLVLDGGDDVKDSPRGTKAKVAESEAKVKAEGQGEGKPSNRGAVKPRSLARLSSCSNCLTLLGNFLAKLTRWLGSLV